MDSSSLSKPEPTAQVIANLQVGRAVRAVGHFRWVICAVLLFGTTKNYMDRQVIGILKNSLQHQFGWSEIDYGNLVFAFQTAYALGMLVVGGLIDWLGTRIGYALAMAGWTIALGQWQARDTVVRVRAPLDDEHRRDGAPARARRVRRG